MRDLRQWRTRGRPGPAAQAEIAKAIGGMLQFLLIARALGASDYGRWVTVALLAAVLLPVCTWGANSTLLRAAARSASRTGLEAYAVRLSLTSGALAAGTAALVTDHLLPGVGAAAAAAVVFAEVGLFNLLGLYALVAQGSGRFVEYRAWSVSTAALRVAAAVAYVSLWTGSGLAGYAVVHLAAAALGAAPLLWRAARRPRHSGPLGVETGDAWLFVLTSVSLRIYDDADKYVLLRTGAAGEAGVYAAAYRLASYALVPVRAVLAHSYPEMFRRSAADPAGVWQLACHAARRSCLLGLAALLPLTCAALALPAVAGSGYANTAVLVLALVPSLSLRGAHYAFGDVLTVLGHQRWRAAAQMLSFSLPLLACLVLIPWAGVWGAVLATAVGEVLTVLVLACLGARLVRRELQAVA